MDQPFSSYYGMLENIKVKDSQTIGIYCVDEIFKSLLEKYEDRLRKNNIKLISDVRNSFKEEIRSFKKKINELSSEIKEIKKKSVKEDPKIKEDTQEIPSTQLIYKK